MSAWFEEFGYAKVHQFPGCLVLGAIPSDYEDIQTLTQLDTDIVVNLCEDSEYINNNREQIEDLYHQLGIKEHRFPCIDFEALSHDNLNAAIEATYQGLLANRTVYLHCRAGWQRSATVASGVIMKLEGLNIFDALQTLQSRKATAQPLPHQIDALYQWTQQTKLS